SRRTAAVQEAHVLAEARQSCPLRLQRFARLGGVAERLPVAGRAKHRAATGDAIPRRPTSVSARQRSSSAVSPGRQFAIGAGTLVSTRASSASWFRTSRTPQQSERASPSSPKGRDRESSLASGNTRCSRSSCRYRNPARSTSVASEVLFIGHLTWAGNERLRRQ